MQIISQLMPIALLVIPTTLIVITIKKYPNLFLSIIMFYVSITSSVLFDPGVNGFNFGINLFGFSVYPMDLFSVLSLFVVLTQKPLLVQTSKQKEKLRSLSKYLLVATLFGIFFWVLNFGLATGYNFWRPLFWPFSIFVYVNSLKKSWTVEDLRKVIIPPAIMLSVLVLYRFATYGIGTSTFIDPNSGVKFSRAANSEGGLLLLIAFWIIALTIEKKGIRHLIVLFVFIFELLLLQQRTVWMCAIFSLIMYVSFKSGTLKKGGRATKFLGVLFLGLILVWIAVQSITLREAATSAETFSWRVNRWVLSVSIDRSLSEWFLGATFGPTPVARPGLFEVFSHSTYIDLIEKLGIFGLGIFICLLWLTFKGFTKSTEMIRKSSYIIAAMSIIFGITYWIPVGALICLGILRSLDISNSIDSTQAIRSKGQGSLGK